MKVWPTEKPFGHPLIENVLGETLCAYVIDFLEKIAWIDAQESMRMIAVEAKFALRSTGYEPVPYAKREHRARHAVRVARRVALQPYNGRIHRDRISGAKNRGGARVRQ